MHAEAYPASELKHGPLALICPETPTVVVVLPRDRSTRSRCPRSRRCAARRGPVIAVTHAGDERLPGKVRRHHAGAAERERAQSDPDDAAAAAARVLRRRASLGRDIDQPRNLAKSVTVE